VRVHEKINRHLAKCDIEVERLSAATEISIERLLAMLSGKEPMYPEDLRSLCYALQVEGDFFVASD